MSYIPPGRFEVGRVLARTVGVISRNFPVLAALSLTLSGVPVLLVGLAQGWVPLPLALSARMDSAGYFSLAGLLGLLISALLQAALIRGTAQDLSGHPVSLGDCLATAIRNVLPLIGISLLSTVVSVLGLVFFIVPGVILSLMLCVSAPAQVVEGHGVFASMGRSGDLTRNHRWSILLLFVIYGLIIILMQSVFAPLRFLAVAIMPHVLGGFLESGLRMVAQALQALIGAAGIASIYFELRSVKEGLGAEALAAAFD